MKGMIFLKFDLTITVATILSIAAIISPIVTAIINNRYHLKIRRLDSEIELRKESAFYNRSIYENYLESAFKYLKHHDADAKHEYSECYALALIYFPESLLPQIIEIDSVLRSSHMANAFDKLENLSKDVRKILQTM